MRIIEEMSSDNEVLTRDVMDFRTDENIVISLEIGLAFLLQVLEIVVNQDFIFHFAIFFLKINKSFMKILQKYHKKFYKNINKNRYKSTKMNKINKNHIKSNKINKYQKII